jgi:UDP-galactopyranose mutase
MKKQVLVVGAGCYGAVCARVLADAGNQCLVIDQRDHIGGNCYSEYNEEAGCHRHVYGAHIFHTDREQVWAFVNRFARFNNFVHRLKARYRDHIYSFPINLLTLHQMFGVLTPADAEAFLSSHQVPCPNPQNLEDLCLSQIGRELYETFIRGYTLKQWHKDPRELPVSVIQRVPVRLTFNDNYYNHPCQGIPFGGYTEMFGRLLDGIDVRTGIDFMENRTEWMNAFDHIVYTGPIDGFFDYSEGSLEYRSLHFENQLLDLQDFQGTAVVNYTEEIVPFTRIIEHKHFDMNIQKPKTIVTYEYPDDWMPGKVPYYPILTERNQLLYECYRSKATKIAHKVTFGGRLGEYKYYDMDEAMGAALHKANELIARWQ